MPSINIVANSKITHTSRTKQLSAMFDVPLSDVSALEWRGELPIESEDWKIGLIVGPSGCGKSTIARELWGENKKLEWLKNSVIDDFDNGLSIQDIASACSSVGFNTIPAWLRPYSVLSTGEKFRVDIARRLLELPSPVIVDEFTSVVDRQTAQIASYAIQKFIRKTDKKFIAVSCHYDIVDWLLPDWIFEPATMTFTWRSLRRRPSIDIEIKRVPYSAWAMFSKFHYLTNELHRAARCFVLFVNGQPASFAGMLHRPHPKVRDIVGISRLVTLPDYQGMGLAMILSDVVGETYKAIGKRVHMYPAHPSLIRSFDRSPKWRMTIKPTKMSPVNRRENMPSAGALGGRPCAVFEYCGEAMQDKTQAADFIGV